MSEDIPRWFWLKVAVLTGLALAVGYLMRFSL